MLVVLEEASGRSKGCGLVEYSTREEAQNAIEQLTNSKLGDRMIFVREDREPEGGSISDIVKRTRYGGGGGGAQYPPLEYYPPQLPPPPPHYAHPHQYAPPPPPPPHHHQFQHMPQYAPILGGGGERQIFIGNVRSCLIEWCLLLAPGELTSGDTVLAAAAGDALEEPQGALLDCRSC